MQITPYLSEGRQAEPLLIRSAKCADAAELANVRLRIDGETENMDREPGEAVLDAQAFERLICSDTEADNCLFLVAVVNNHIAGFSRCEGSALKRLSHHVTFGVGVLKMYWGLGIGSQFLRCSLDWAVASGIQKMNLSVLETNTNARRLYEKFGFEVEGILRRDKRLSDGNFYATILMGRLLQP